MDDNRPYILFDRLYNKGQKTRERKDRRTGQIRETWRGEFRDEWKCYLTRENLDPYIWARPAYFARKISDDCQPIAIGNMDTLPADYSKRWRAQLDGCINYVNQFIAMRQRIEALEAEADGKAKTKTKLRKSGESGAAHGEGVSSTQAA